MPKLLKAVCICGNKKSFQKCCGRFLEGGETAKTPEQLMRSRYSAYALGGFGEYLLSTWFPATASGLTVEELSLNTVYWRSLEVIDKCQQGDKGEVEFRAYFSRKENDEVLEAMHERSNFVRRSGRWYYVGGEVGSAVGDLKSSS